MKHGIAFRKLGRTSSHRDIMLRNLVSSLLEHGQIKTTVAKAKETARLAEKMITLGKRGDEWARKSAQAFLFKHEITLPLLFDEYASRFSERPGGYTRIHFHGNRLGDNAPHAIIELVDGPRDLRFEMTARAVGRETAEAALQGQSASVAPANSNASGPQLRPLTHLNMQKVLKYRSEADKEHFREIAAQWANRVITEPQVTEGLRHPVKRIHVSASAEQQKNESTSTDGPTQQRFKYAYETPEGRTLRAGERLVGVPPSKSSSPMALARGQLGSPRKSTRSALWENATQQALATHKARGGQPIANPPS